MEKTLGILMLDTKFPRIPGDIGNPKTFDYPIRKLIVEGANPQSVVMKADPNLLEPFIRAARQLEAEGVTVNGRSAAVGTVIAEKDISSDGPTIDVVVGGA